MTTTISSNGDKSMGINIKVNKKVMDIPYQRLRDMQAIGKIPKDAKVTQNGALAHVEFEVKTK